MKVSSTRPKVNYETKERIKHGGTTWEIHKNDPDPIPSKPHLHNLETGEKLNPFTGEIYNPKIKKMTGTMKEKDLDELKQKSKLLSQTSQK
ncbi:hypothetical protein HYU12_03015 [Candidatus Woesearchaeota archaeon]|nr:hypothetical protein [Candidatus Woesearchaeota archaeon]